MPTTISKILEALEGLYGQQEPAWPRDPYLYLVWLHCGYPASDDRCSKGWESLRKTVGVEPEQILAAPLSQLTKALSPGGMVPAIRAKRLQQVAARVIEECAGDLASALLSPAPAARKLLKKFPNIADPGADRILLFAGISPVAAVPSNCPHVIVRIMRGRERENYGATYGEAQHEIESLPANSSARTRAFLLLKRHGQELCKRVKPKCGECPVREACAFHLGHHRGRGAVTY
jgi:endonuclease III